MAPRAIVHAAYEKQKRNPGVTEIVQIPHRGHALTIDSGWRKVAQITLDFVKRFIEPLPPMSSDLHTGSTMP